VSYCKVELLPFGLASCFASTPAFFIADMAGSQYGKYTSMKQLVTEFSNIFKFPFKKSTNQVNNGVRKKIVTEIFDTEQTYLKALNDVVHVVHVCATDLPF
jgi:hypothetical protein